MQQTVPSPHAYAQQNFQIFWVGISYRVNVDYTLWIANVCELLNMSNTYIEMHDANFKVH